MKLTNIKKFRPMTNNVIIRLSGLNDTLEMADGTKLYLETKYEPAYHCPVVGTIVGIPERLYFNKNDLSYSMEHETTMELKVGDVAYLDYFLVLQALADKYDQAASFPDPRWFEYKDDLYIILQYSGVYFVIRDEEIIPVNGNCIAKELKFKSKNELIPNYLKTSKSKKWGELIHVGQPCTDFVDRRYSDGADLKAGDIVLFSRWSNQRVEYGLHQTFLKGSDYAVIHRKYIKARYNGELADKAVLVEMM